MDSLKLAKFYAAANPAVVLELVRRLREAEETIARLRIDMASPLNEVMLDCVKHFAPVLSLNVCKCYTPEQKRLCVNKNDCVKVEAQSEASADAS